MHALRVLHGQVGAATQVDVLSCDPDAKTAIVRVRRSPHFMLHRVHDENDVVRDDGHHRDQMCSSLFYERERDMLFRIVTII